MPTQTYAQRRAALDEVLARVARRQTGTDSYHNDPVQPLPAAFTDTGELLTTAHYLWHSHLGARIDAALESVDTPADAIRQAYRDAAQAMPELRDLLDRYAGHPVLARAEQRELALLAQAAGMATPSTPPDRAAALGRQLQSAAIAEARAAAPAPRPRRPHRRWLCRLRNALAA